MTTPNPETLLKMALERGYVIERYQVLPSIYGYQLKNPSGHYVQFGHSPETVIMKAWVRGEVDITPDELETRQYHESKNQSDESESE